MTAAKAELRRRALAARDAAHRPEEAGRAQEFLAHTLAPFAGAPLAGYLPIRSEIDARPVMQAWQGPVGVPEVVRQHAPLRFVAWHPEAALVAGPLGVMVPAGAEPLVPRVLIVPLVAFDATGHRMGYGGGFYDRTLTQLRAAGTVTAVGFAWAGQEVDDVLGGETDAPLNAIVTEKGVRWFS